MPQERFFKKTYMGPYPAVSASGFQLHSAKIKRESAVCLHYAFFYLPVFSQLFVYIMHYLLTCFLFP